jgi:hypothetical protein
MSITNDFTFIPLYSLDQMTDKNEIIDHLPDFSRSSADIRINRFEIYYSDHGLMIKEGRTKNRRRAMKAILGMVICLAFSFLTFMSLLIEMGVFSTLILFAVSIFFLGYVAYQIIKGYFSDKQLLFDEKELIITQILGSPKRIQKNEVDRIYVRDLITPSERELEIRLGKKKRHSIHDDYPLLTVDFPNGSWFSAQKNLAHAEKTKSEAYEIGQKIAEFWKIPFKV